MARSVNFDKKVEKLKRGLDDLLSEINSKLQGDMSARKIKSHHCQICQDPARVRGVQGRQIQQKISQLLILRTKGKEDRGE